MCNNTRQATEGMYPYTFIYWYKYIISCRYDVDDVVRTRNITGSWG